MRSSGPDTHREPRRLGVHDRVLGLVLRPTAPPLIWGIVTAIGLLVIEVVAVLQLKRIAPDNAFGALLLLGVLVVSAGWGFGLALAMTVASGVAYVYFHVGGGDNPLPAVIVFLTVALLTNLLVEQARLRAAEADQRRGEADLATELTRLMWQAPDISTGLDAAGRRLAAGLGIAFASLTTRPTAEDPAQSAVPLHDDTDQVGYVLVPSDLGRHARARVGRMTGALGSLLATARQREAMIAALEVSRRELERFFALTSELLCIGDRDGFRRINPSFERVLGYRADDVRSTPFLELVGDDDRAAVDPIITGALRDGGTVQFEARCRCRGGGTRWLEWSLVGDRGAFFAAARDVTERRAEQERLIETQHELTASRARIVAASDQARRRFERDLHDGAQQRIVSLGLEVGSIEAALGPGQEELRANLSQVVDDLHSLHTELQELSRGIHPAILSRGGLGPALKVLARRYAFPVDLDIHVDGRLPESVEVAAYYVVAEALTNAAKHAQAKEAAVAVCVESGRLRLEVTDDGVGGATASGGSGLTGLRDRVEAISGTLEVSSPVGAGTRLRATIPF